jgi:uncharacterized protein (DUF2384 family)
MATVPGPIMPANNPTSVTVGLGLSAAELQDLARQVFGTQKAADFWMNRSNPELAGKTPNDLIATGQAQIVKDFLEGILAGNYS